jgi:hypothetical protein
VSAAWPNNHISSASQTWPEGYPQWPPLTSALPPRRTVSLRHRPADGRCSRPTIVGGTRRPTCHDERADCSAGGL